jgi:hypothetical protein
MGWAQPVSRPSTRTFRRQGAVFPADLDTARAAIAAGEGMHVVARRDRASADSLREHVNDINGMDDDELIARANYVLSLILSAYNDDESYYVTNVSGRLT